MQNLKLLLQKHGRNKFCTILCGTLNDDNGKIGIDRGNTLQGHNVLFFKGKTRSFSIFSSHLNMAGYSTADGGLPLITQQYGALDGSAYEWNRLGMNWQRPSLQCKP